MKEICKGYKDSKGNQYYVGDLVLNTYFGDIWLIEKYTEQEMKNYKTECPYCLVLNGHRDDHFMDLDEPEGFIIEKHLDEDGYKELLDECEKVYKEFKEIINNENTKRNIESDT